MTTVCQPQRVSIAETYTQLVGRGGVDVIFDVIGGETETRALDAKLLGTSGHYINVLKDEKDLLATAVGLAKWLVGLGPHYGLCAVLPNPAVLGRLVALLDAGDIVPEVDSVFELAEAAEATRRLETGRAHGKILLRVARDAE